MNWMTLLTMIVNKTRLYETLCQSNQTMLTMVLGFMKIINL